MDDRRDSPSASSTKKPPTQSKRQHRRHTQPLVTVGDAPVRAPSSLVLGPANGPERLSRGREPVPDVPLLTRGGVDQDEAEVRVVRVKGHAAADPVGVVVRVREDAGERSVAHDPEYRPDTLLPPRSPCW
jgi:hypothetical protein